MPFDVGAVTSEIQRDFRLFQPQSRPAVNAEPATNRATPENLAVLIGALEDLTAEIESRRADQIAGWLPNIGIVMWDGSFAQWKTRLAGYRAAVDAAPPGDRVSILWTVTAPLLLGFYGGPTSQDPRRPIDAGTPFSLSNQLQVAADWQDEQWRLFKDDLAKGLRETIIALSGATVVVGVAVIAFIVARHISK